MQRYPSVVLRSHPTVRHVLRERMSNWLPTTAASPSATSMQRWGRGRAALAHAEDGSAASASQRLSEEIRKSLIVAGRRGSVVDSNGVFDCVAVLCGVLLNLIANVA